MPPIDLLAELAAGADLVRRHVLLPAIGALIGDERQRDEDDRGRQQARPVIVAGRTLEPIVVRDPLAGSLRHAGDLVRQISPPPVPPGRRIDRAANGTIRAMPRSAAQNRKPPPTLLRRDRCEKPNGFRQYRLAPCGRDRDCAYA